MHTISAIIYQLLYPLLTTTNPHMHTISATIYVAKTTVNHHQPPHGHLQQTLVALKSFNIVVSTWLTHEHTANILLLVNCFSLFSCQVCMKAKMYVWCVGSVFLLLMSTWWNIYFKTIYSRIKHTCMCRSIHTQMHAHPHACADACTQNPSIDVHMERPMHRCITQTHTHRDAQALIHKCTCAWTDAHYKKEAQTDAQTDTCMHTDAHTGAGMHRWTDAWMQTGTLSTYWTMHIQINAHMLMHTCT